ncbi:hypothetical protein DENIS_2522 [Desulfonema ishimotonii]|uniref:DUF4154 domain-containing protein n=1 Tax=Desulfonema ishimotonii TaxID=45657 RepID=A0A401FX74_9BACT|nr:YfiR/HmsC family protein [Desulfonema ishimotonii]GBC61560.1 hypothetical protein DENIS_2522 [Desulfonema ishimotonii]
MKKKITAFVFIIVSVLSSGAYAEPGYAPVDIQATLFIKLFIFNNDLNKGKDITIHVINSPEFAAEIRKSVGKKIGKSKLISVSEADSLPSEKPSVIYLGNPAMLKEALEYTRKKEVLSITGIPELIEKGVTLGIGVVDKKPKIFFNVSSSEREDMDWNPVILKISTILK